tara:strand:+ start:159 stop:449 length:291 start_codon:yes stop_codon:yes gene_type:complete
MKRFININNNTLSYSPRLFKAVITTNNLSKHPTEYDESDEIELQKDTMTLEEREKQLDSYFNVRKYGGRKSNKQKEKEAKELIFKKRVGKFIIPFT